MALYHKKLRTFEDLQREKKLLKKEMARLDKDESMSFGGVMGGGKKEKKSKKEKEEGGSGLSSMIDMLPISSPVTIGLLKLVADRFMKSRGGNDRRERDDRYYEVPKPKKHYIRNAAVEVLGGYLKWKAVELGYKGVKHLVAKRKEKKAYAASLEFPSNK